MGRRHVFNIRARLMAWKDEKQKSGKKRAEEEEKRNSQQKGCRQENASPRRYMCTIWIMYRVISLGDVTDTAVNLKHYSGSTGPIPPGTMNGGYLTVARVGSDN